MGFNSGFKGLKKITLTARYAVGNSNILRHEVKTFLVAVSVLRYHRYDHVEST